MRRLGIARIQEIQKTSGFTKNQTVRVYFINEGNKYYTVKMHNGELKVLNVGAPDVKIYFKSDCILKHVRKGYKAKITRYYGGRTERHVHPYTLMDAVAANDIQVDPEEDEGTDTVGAKGDGTTGDTLAACAFVLDLLAEIPEEEIERVIGPCEHD